jgi:hypothetical protein
MDRARQRLFILGVVTAALVEVSSAQCVIFDNPEELFARADVVFVGTVTSTQETGAGGAHQTVEIATLRVDRLFKGRPGREIRVGADAPFRVGQRYVVFAAGNPPSTSIMCRSTEPVSRAKKKLDWLAKRREAPHR